MREERLLGGYLGLIEDVRVERGHLRFRLVNRSGGRLVVNPVEVWACYGVREDMKSAGEIATTQSGRVNVETAPKVRVSVVRNPGGQVPPFI